MDSSHFNNTVRDSVWMNVWYADTLTNRKPLDTIPHTVYRFRAYPDSTEESAPSIGTETWRPSPGPLVASMWKGGIFAPADTNLRWLHFGIADLDSSTTTSLYPDSLSDRAASGQAAIVDILHVLDATLPALPFPDTRTQRRITLSQQGMRGRQGTVRINMIKGSLDYLDGVRQPVRVRFQSASIADAQITATSTPYRAQNETGSGKAPSVAWIVERLAKAPLLVELGFYDAGGRKRGTWALLNGWLDYNVAFCIRELAPASERCIIETAVSFEYDPTIVFTDVAEDASREIASVDVIPNPARDVVAIRADLTRSTVATVSLFTTLGEIVLQRTVTSDELMHGMQMSLQSVSTGHYLIRITTAQAVFTQQFVKIQ